MSSLETFSYSDEDFLFEVDPLHPKTTFDDLLQSKCNSKMEEGNIFWNKFQVTSQRNISDKYFLQYIPSRASARKSSFVYHSVTEPFDSKKFNFNKIKEEEKLFNFVNKNCPTEEAQVIVNVSPLAPCSVLLVPAPEKCIPQVLTETSVKTAIEFSLLSGSRYFRLGFNGQAAYASVNHLHFHAYYLECDMFLEGVIVEELVYPCYQLLDYPAKGFVFQVKSKEEIPFIAKSIFKLVKLFHSRDIAHNLFISRGVDFESAKIAKEKGKRNCLRIYIWARKPSLDVKDSTKFNIALCELFGHMVIKNETDYRTLTEESINAALRELTDEPFSSVIREAKNLF